MKLTKKKVFVSALAICLIAIISMGTLAWFSAQDEVTNNFMIADSDDDTPDEIFSVDVWENTPDGDKDQDGYEYTDILPGDTLKKEARVENTGHYDQYVRVTVTISDAEAWIAALGANFNVADVFDGFVASDWNHIWNNMNGATTIPENFVYVMYYKDIVEPGDVIEVFNNVKSFNCGIYNGSEKNIGATITVELRMYETMPREETGVLNSTNVETGRFVTIATVPCTISALAA